MSSSLQLNLLPSVKQEYIAAQKQKRLVLGISIIIAGVAIFILVLLLIVDLAQKKHLHDLNNNISSETTTLKSEPQIGKILTVQNQLESLTSLHAAKPAVSKLFTAYINQVTPAAATISDFNINFGTNTITITGNADSLTTVNKYIDTLKFTTYTSGSNSTPSNAFSNVVLTNFSLSSASTNSAQAATYTITLSYNTAIFDITQNPTLSVPNLITTRSELAQPGDLFQSQPTPTPTPNTSGGGH